MAKNRGNTGWEGVDKWYNNLVGKEGHYYHQNVIFPKLLPLLKLSEDSHVLDLACGQGVLAEQLPQEIPYHGVDLSSSLIKAAQKNKNRVFTVADICKPLSLENSFSHATIILALQNVQDPAAALKNAAKHLKKEGILAIVLNHPSFRIPRQTHWQIDAASKTQYRRVDRYMTPLKIPIQTHPGKNQQTTWSFHFPLHDYFSFLSESGFVTLQLEEWVSDKKSQGKSARMENRAREEFPLFLTLIAQKIR